MGNSPVAGTSMASSRVKLAMFRTGKDDEAPLRRNPRASRGARDKIFKHCLLQICVERIRQHKSTLSAKVKITCRLTYAMAGGTP